MCWIRYEPANTFVCSCNLSETATLISSFVGNDGLEMGHYLQKEYYTTQNWFDRKQGEPVSQSEYGPDSNPDPVSPLTLSLSGNRRTSSVRSSSCSVKVFTDGKGNLSKVVTTVGTGTGDRGSNRPQRTDHNGPGPRYVSCTLPECMNFLTHRHPPVHLY